MDVKDFLCMSGGEGDNSYAKNGVFARRVLAVTRPVLDKSIQDLWLSMEQQGDPQPVVLTMADLGCSSGPNTMSVISTIVRGLEKLRRESNCGPLELQMLLNDLPQTDFSSIFRSLPPVLQQLGVGAGGDHGSLLCFVSGVPGPFYGRLFPRQSLHLVHSSYSVHWLSQVPSGLNDDKGAPLNKGKIYISKSSPPGVWKAYLEQFQKDFSVFLKCRSEEMVPNGRMVLIFQGRRDSSEPSDRESSYSWEVIAEALSDLVSQGLTEEGKLDSFDVPYYTPSSREIEDVALKEGSFTMEKLEISALDPADDGEKDMWIKGERLAKNIRAYTEPLLAYHFGQEIMDKLYDKLTHIVVDDLAKGNTKAISIIAVLGRKF